MVYKCDQHYENRASKFVVNMRKLTNHNVYGITMRKYSNNYSNNGDITTQSHIWMSLELGSSVELISE